MPRPSIYPFRTRKRFFVPLTSQASLTDLQCSILGCARHHGIKVTTRQAPRKYGVYVTRQEQP